MQNENESGNGTVAGNGAATGNGAAAGNGTATGHLLGNGTGNKPLGTWTLAGRTYTNYADFCEARDRRQREFLTRSGGATTEELGPPLVLPEDATPENFQPEAEWPVSAEIDEALKNRFRLFSGAQLKSGLKTGKDKRVSDSRHSGGRAAGGNLRRFQDAQDVAGGRPVDLVGQWHAVPRAVSGREAGAGAVSVGRSGARGAQGDGRPHLSRARHVAGVARELSAFARSAAARSARRRDGSPRVDRGSAADLPGDRPDLAGDGRLEQPQSVRRRRCCGSWSSCATRRAARFSSCITPSVRTKRARRPRSTTLPGAALPSSPPSGSWSRDGGRTTPTQAITSCGSPRAAGRDMPACGARRRRGCTTRLAGRGTDGVRGRRLPHLEGGPPLGRLGRGTSGRTIRRHP